MLETLLVLALAAILLVTLAKSMFQIVKVEPNTVYTSTQTGTKYIVLSKTNEQVTLGNYDLNVKFTIPMNTFYENFKKLENL